MCMTDINFSVKLKFQFTVLCNLYEELLNKLMKESYLPLEVVDTHLRHIIMEHTHSLHHLLLSLRLAHNVELGQEMVGHCNQGIFWPASEPVHGASRDQTRELE